MLLLEEIKDKLILLILITSIISESIPTFSLISDPTLPPPTNPPTFPPTDPPTLPPTDPPTVPPTQLPTVTPATARPPIVTSTEIIPPDKHHFGRLAEKDWRTDLKPVFHLAIFSREQAKRECGWVVMSSVFVASQSSCFFPRSRNQIRLAGKQA